MRHVDCRHGIVGKHEEPRARRMRRHAARRLQYKRDFADSYRASRDVALARSLNPALQDFKAWLGAHARQIPL